MHRSVSRSRSGDLRNVIALISIDLSAYVKARFAIAVILIITVAILTALGPLFLKLIVDRFGQQQAGPELPMGLVLASYVGVQFLARAAGELRGLLYALAERRVFRSFSERVFAHLARLPFRYHLQSRTGAVAQALDNGLQGYQLLLHHMVFTLLPVMAELCTIVVVLARLDQRLFLGLFCGAVLCYATAFAFGARKLADPAQHASRAQVESSATLLDGLQCIETVKCFTAEPVVQAKISAALARTEIAWLEFYRRFARNGLTISLLFAGFLGTTVLLSVHEAKSGRIGVGDFVLLNAYMLQVVRPIEMAGYAVQGLAQGVAMLQGILEILRQPAERDSLPGHRGEQLQHVACGLTGNKELPRSLAGRENTAAPALAFTDVSFAYEPGRPVLQNVNFTLPRGASLAVVGRSGCGKSTLARLIVRLLEADLGRISLDGVPIVDIPVRMLRQCVAVVPQETILLNDTIHCNIAFGSERHTRGEVEEAANHACLHEFVRNLPRGYDTVVGERGVRLSGGEKQRIAIARAMLRQPRVFVLDECTASLDSRTECEIIRNLHKAFRSSATLIIAHRLSTVVRANQIIVLEAGRLVEAGSHASLLASQGRYFALWRAQQADHLAA